MKFVDLRQSATGPYEHKSLPIAPAKHTRQTLRNAAHQSRTHTCQPLTCLSAAVTQRLSILLSGGTRRQLQLTEIVDFWIKYNGGDFGIKI